MFFRCDPLKNEACKKRNCYVTGAGNCSLTTNMNCSIDGLPLDNDRGSYITAAQKERKEQWEKNS